MLRVEKLKIPYSFGGSQDGIERSKRVSEEMERSIGVPEANLGRYVPTWS